MYKILYIEDDELDAMNMKIICNTFSDVKLEIADNFAHLKHTNSIKPSFIITDRKVGLDTFESYIDSLKKYPYFVLSNRVDFNNKLNHAPIKYFSKPFTKDKLKEVLSKISHQENQANFNYFDVFEDENIKREMQNLLYNELKDANRFIPIEIEKEDYLALENRIHKLSSKFSILGMEHTFTIAKEIEKKLRQKCMDKTLLDTFIIDIKKAITFCNLNLKT